MTLAASRVRGSLIGVGAGGRDTGTAVVFGACPGSSRSACPAECLPDLKRGYVIFQNSRSAQSLATLLATDSPFTHVGIVDCDDSGNPVVLEAVRTTRATPLRDRVSHGEGSDAAICRMHDLSEDQALAVTRAARSHFGMGHDPYVYRTEEALYCGEADGAEACLTLIRDVPLVTPQAMAEDGGRGRAAAPGPLQLRGRASGPLFVRLRLLIAGTRATRRRSRTRSSLCLEAPPALV